MNYGAYGYETPDNAPKILQIDYGKLRNILKRY